MLHRSILSLLALVALLGLFFATGSEPASGQEKAPITTIEGTTLIWMGGKKYEPVDKVDIVVSRGGGVVANPKAKDKHMGWTSAGKGRFEIKIRSGEPVVVLFHFNDKYVPQVQMLAAGADQRHLISPALISVKDYLAAEKKGDNPIPLRTLIATAGRALPKDGNDDLAKKLRKDFSTILGATTQLTSLLVPAYFDPATPAGRENWQQLEKEAKQVPIVAIANPNSGPGSPTEQRLYLPVLRSARRAGVTLVGYVFTDYAKKPIEDSMKEITAWKRLYGKELSGIFLDAQAPGKTSLKYYRSLSSHIRKEFASVTPLILGNPGTTFDEEFLLDANYAAVFYENGTATKLVDLKIPDFLDRGYWPQSCVLAHKVNDRKDMETLVKDLTKKEIGYVYVTDAHLHNGVLNPWSRLPSYWKQEVAAVAAANKARRVDILRPR